MKVGDLVKYSDRRLALLKGDRLERAKKWRGVVKGIQPAQASKFDIIVAESFGDEGIIRVYSFMVEEIWQGNTSTQAR